MKHLTCLILFFIALTLHVKSQITYGEKRVVFPQEMSLMLTNINDTSFNRFTPSVEDIDSADIFLEKYLKTLLNKDSRSLKVEDYFRQYVGLFLKGRKCVYVNASCRKSEQFLQNTFYPKGGGECYFRTLVDIGNKRVFDFSLNASR